MAWPEPLPAKSPEYAAEGYRLTAPAGPQNDFTLAVTWPNSFIFNMTAMHL